MTMRKKSALRWAALALAVCCWTVPAAHALTFTDEAEFLQAVVNPTTVSFDLLSVGTAPPPPFQLGDVSVELTDSFGLIFGPGPFGFTTNFLSVGVQDGANNVVISFPAGTTAAGMKLVSVFPVTVTATYGDSGTETVTFSASEVAFLGFTDGSGLQSIRISSPLGPSGTPIVNVGDITYASPSQIVEIPALSEDGLLLLALALLAAGWRMLAPR